MISAKMLDGFGKSMYSLLFTVAKVILEIVFVYSLSLVLHNGSCVLLGIVGSEIISAIIYYLFLKYLFKNFNEKYEGKETVKTFNNDESSKDHEIKTGDENRGLKSNKYFNKIPLILALISMVVILLTIVSMPLRQHNYPLLISGATALIIGALSTYSMEKLNKPKLSVIGFIGCAVILFIFMGRNGYVATLLYIITGVLILYIKLIAHRLEEK